MRVVSLLPSATEALCSIGGESLLVGRSHECDYPPSILDRPVLTGPLIDSSSSPAAIDGKVREALNTGTSLYRLDIERLQALGPDVILTQDLCKVCSIDLETVRRAARQLSPEPKVVSLNPHSFEDVFDDLVKIGLAVGLDQQARETLVALRERFFRASDYVNAFTAKPRLVFLEWADPLFVGGHWTPQLIERAGADHPLNPTRPMEGAGDGAGGQMAHRIAGPSLPITPEQLVAANPDRLIICPCGVKLRDIPEHLATISSTAWYQGLRAVREGQVAYVDGNEMFNRPGPRLVDAYEWLVGWLNDRPEVIPDSYPWIRIDSKAKL